MRRTLATIAVAFVGLAVVLSGALVVTGVLAPPLAPTPGGQPPDTSGWSTEEPGLEPFESEDDFMEYLDRNTRETSALNGGLSWGLVGEEGMVVLDGGVPRESSSMEVYEAGGTEPVEVSSTNVQVADLDEPDILKTDGASVFAGSHRFTREGNETLVFDVSESDRPTRVAAIPTAGELLLIDERDLLVVFEEHRLVGYDVSDPAAPTERWEADVEGSVQTARLDGGALYVIFVDRPDLDDDPCPHEPYADEEIACDEIYRPTTDAAVDAIYTAARIDPESGELIDQASVVGSTHRSATYVSENAIYLTYSRSISDYDLLVAYLTGPGSGQLDGRTLDRVRALDELDISERAKRVELSDILEDWFERMDEETREVARERLREGMQSYVEDHQRDLVRTGITRISLGETIEVEAAGEVPGYPLNQWSMDEHEGHLRIATTVPASHGVDSVNDVYVLDETLTVTGSVKGLGETERIYAVRFEGDEGHVVTFRQIDPFYTLDLSDPTDPRLEGELKIPGVSHYLHPLDDSSEIILGVGEEDRRVKLSLFDVSDREEPIEIDTELLGDERFTVVNENHRAFLHDERHEVFFLPAGERSYVFSYADDELEEVASIDMGGPEVRAMYLDDYLYVFGPNGLVVLDEQTWEVATELRFD